MPTVDISQKTLFRLLFVAVVLLALWGGLGWERARQARENCSSSQERK